MTTGEKNRRNPEEVGPGLGGGSAIVVGLGLVIAVVVAGFLSSNEQTQRKPPSETPKRGVSCPYLARAFNEFEEGDQAAFERAISLAAAAGEAALETSGEVFGRPESLSLALAGLEGTDSRRTAALLGEASTACTRLGRWPPNAPLSADVSD